MVFFFSIFQNLLVNFFLIFFFSEKDEITDRGIIAITKNRRLQHLDATNRSNLSERTLNSLYRCTEVCFCLFFLIYFSFNIDPCFFSVKNNYFGGMSQNYPNTPQQIRHSPSQCPCPSHSSTKGNPQRKSLA